EMKLQSGLQVLVGFALLIACAIGCKFSTSSTSSTNEKKSTSTISTTATPSAPIDVAGKYNIVGTNQNGGANKGKLEVIARGDVYQFRWSAGSQSDGIGITNGNVVAVAFASGADGKGCGVVDYDIKGDGTLDGKWGYWGTNEAGTETAART